MNMEICLMCIIQAVIKSVMQVRVAVKTVDNQTDVFCDIWL